MTIVDKLLFCPYCGSISKGLTKEQIKVFGKPTCCEYLMVEMDKCKIHAVARALDTLKKNLETEILQGME